MSQAHPDGHARQKKQVFISYSHEPPENAVFVRNLASLLDAAGFLVWLDEQEISGGAHFERMITKAAGESEIAVFIATRRWVERPWTRQEVRLFGERGDDVRLVVVAREEVNTGDLGPYLAGLHTIKWLNTDEEPLARLWEVFCGVTGEKPGPRAAWADRGRAVAAGAPASKAASQPVRVVAEQPAALPCKGRPIDYVVGEEQMILLTDADEWLSIGDDGLCSLMPPLPNALSWTVGSRDRIAVGLYDSMLAKAHGGRWHYQQLPSPALSLCAGADRDFVGTTTGLIVQVLDAAVQPLCHVRDPVIALAVCDEALLVLGAQGLFGQIALPTGPDASRAGLQWLDAGAVGRPVAFFQAAVSHQIGLIGVSRVGVADLWTKAVATCPSVFADGVRRVEFLGPQRWPYAVLTDGGQVFFVTDTLDSATAAPMPPNATAVGCCRAAGRALALIWTREGRLYRINALGQPAERLLDGGVVLAFASATRHGAIVAILWDEAAGALMRVVGP